MANELENKFKEKMEKHPNRWTLRLMLEPGYMLKNCLTIPKEKREGLITLVGTAEVGRLAVYGFIAYKIADYIF